MKKKYQSVKNPFILWLVMAALFFGQVFGLPTANAQSSILESGWENGQPTGVGDRVEYSKDVLGWNDSSSPPPECSRRYREVVRNGDYSLVIAGSSKASYAYCYYRVFEQNINVVSGMKIGYWIYHQTGTAKIGVDGRFTDGQTIRDFGGGVLKDQYGVKIHPAARRDPMNQWYYVEVDMSPAAGKTIQFIMFAFDNGNDGFQGKYRAYVDDFKIFIGGSTACQASVSSDRWKGEYFNNISLSGSPVMVRDDRNGFLGFDWGSGSPNGSCGIPSDNFSARWTRTVNFAAGTYKFTITADDGVRFWIDNQLLLDKWIDQAPTTYTVGPVNLTVGNHNLRMEFYERGGGATAKLSWEATVNPCLASVPADRWKGEYFGNINLLGSPVMVRDDGNGFLGFDWGSGSPNSSCNVSSDNFSVRWARTVNFSSGSYVFTVRVDDGVRLWVNGQILIDQWRDQAPTTYTSQPVSLSGNSNIRMEFYERGGGATAQLSWQLRSPDPEPVPTGKSKLTIHGGFNGGESMRFVEQAKPAVVKILDRVEVAREIAQKSSNTLIVARIYLPNQPMDGDPIQRANEWWNRVGGTILNTPDVDYWEGYNEPGNLNPTEMDWYARHEKRRVEILAENGRKACIGNFSTGTPRAPEEDGGAAWRAFLPAIDAAMAHGGVLGLHEYSAPRMQDAYTGDTANGEGWLTGRYRKVYGDFLIPNGRRIPLVITEAGIDGGATGGCPSGGCGWKSYQSAENYFNQLKWYDEVLKHDDYVLGATIYCVELPDPQWDSFDIRGGILNYLIDYVK